MEELDRKILDFVTLSGKLMEAMQTKLASIQEASKRASTLIEPTVKVLIHQGRIRPELEKVAQEKLSDHATALEILANAVSYAPDQDRLGEPDRGTKRAQDDSHNSAYVGGHRSGKRESDLVLDRFVFGGR